MDRKERIQQEIDKTLEQFDNAERIKPNPFLLTRIEARIREEKRERKFSVARTVLRPALLLIILAANIFTISEFLHYRTESTGSNDTMSVFAKEFGLQTSVEDPFSIIE